MNNYFKLLITGANGQLATALQHHPLAQSFQLIPCSRAELDITDEAAVTRVLDAHQPTIVINTAAYTAVDKAQNEPSQAMLVNAIGAKNLAQYCGAKRIPLIHLSTDYVFDGKQQRPYQEDDQPHPINVYGETKLLGEQAIREHCGEHVILRISGVFSEFGNNFLKTMLRLANEKETLDVVDDQITCPTYTGDIATALFTIARQPVWGTYHYCSAPPISWFHFAAEIIAKAQSIRTLMVSRVNAISSAHYPTAAKRPAYSVLDCAKIKRDYGLTTPSWQRAVQQIVPVLLEDN